MPIITAENLGKKYLIGHQSERESYTALRDVIAQSAKQWVSKTRQLLRGEQLLEGDTREEFWALQDLNFEIEAGDRVGIIGRNGAGKSTLLKILSRITEPTTGRVVINGRVASLLEVGTGFHPELSGRENIYLNGAILGMSRAEIRRKFDEIVAFAGVEKFIDTPVKRYSSGMYVRLAFSVAAHLEPEILVVDEVLAVGDAEFQKKCLGKMEDVSKNEGRTVLFVSHNMGAIQALCDRCLHLSNGLMFEEPGNTEDIISNYLKSTRSAVAGEGISKRKDRSGKGDLRVLDIQILDQHDERLEYLISGKETNFKVIFENTKGHQDGDTLEVSLSITRLGEHAVTLMGTNFLGIELKNSSMSNWVSFCIPKLPLSAGTYSMNVMLKKSSII